MSETWTVHGNEIAQRVAEHRGSHDLRLTGAGTEFLFYSANRGTRGEGYRIPRSRKFETVNNPGIWALELQTKEMNLCLWALEKGLPSSRPLALADQDGVPVLITEIIDDDGSVASSEILGGLLSDLHNAAPPESLQSNLSHQSIYEQIASRMTLRYEKLRSKNSLPPMPPRHVITELLGGALRRNSLLHMDIRRQNIRCQNGRPLALFDWSNALIAAPELEMARLEEYAAVSENGLDFAGIHANYLKCGGTLNQDPDVWSLLRLDSALMLAGVFGSIARNLELKELFVTRSRMLLETL